MVSLLGVGRCWRSNHDPLGETRSTPREAEIGSQNDQHFRRSLGSVWSILIHEHSVLTSDALDWLAIYLSTKTI